MIYVKFPNPELLKDPRFVAWEKKARAGKSPDWRELFPWLIKHTQKAWETEPDLKNLPGKCWFSEAPLYAGHGKDVEHFRPKNEANSFTQKQKKRIEDILIKDIPVNDSLPVLGYTWAEYDYRNYRLSHPGVNRAGNKDTSFPILTGQKRITKTQFDKGIREYYLLLDPACKEDCALLSVSVGGEIEPIVAPSIPPPDFNLKATYYYDHREDYIKYVRAVISIIVYGLDHIDFQNARAGKFQAVRTKLLELESAIQSPENRWVKACSRNLLIMAAGCTEFALAARCALRSYIPSGSLNSSQKSRLKTIVSRILVEIERREG